MCGCTGTFSHITSLCAGAQGHLVTSSHLTSLCADAQGHPVTLLWLMSSIIQGQSRSGHYQVHCWGLVWVYISSISWDGGLLLQAEWWRTASAVPVSFGVPDCVRQGMCTAGVFYSMWGTAGGCSCSCLRCCRCKMWCWLCWLGGRQVCGCSGSYICGDMLVQLDSIWVMLMNVVMSMLILSTANNLDNVWSMVCCADNGGREL